jgi:sigma-B regulation protein RsbU (phosphoserine phosphatase)
MFEDVTYEQGTVQLDAGDIIVVFSDGVSEALSVQNEEFGEARLQEVIERDLNAGPQEMLELLLEAVRNFTRGAVQNDDVTALVVRYVGA